MFNKFVGNVAGSLKNDKQKSGIWNINDVSSLKTKNETKGKTWYSDNIIQDYQVLYVPLDNTSWDAYGSGGSSVGIVTAAPNASVGFATTSPSNNFGIRGSMYNDAGQSDRFITIPANSNFSLGSSDFTIDIFINRTSTGWFEGGTVVEARNTSTNQGPWYIEYAANQGNSLPTLYVDNSNGANVFQAFQTTTLSGSTWYHYRWSRNGNKMRTFTNGILRNTYDFTNPHVPINQNNHPIRIGFGAKGYFGHLRIIKGIGLNGNDLGDFYNNRLPI